MFRFLLRLTLIFGGAITLLITALTAIPRRGVEVPPSAWLIDATDNYNKQLLLKRFNDHFARSIGFSDYYARPQWSPDGRWIAVAASSATDAGIYRMRPDGSEIRVLIRRPENWYLHISWSPDSQWIIFDDPAVKSIYRIRPNGADLQVIAQNASYYTPSPDGYWLLFQSDDAMYRVRSDGSDLQRISDTLFSLPIWSPDSQWIVYQSENATYRIRADGTEQHLIASGDIQYSSDGWSPNSEWLAVLIRDDSGGPRPYLLRSNGSELNLLQHYIEFIPPSWSPNGEWIITGMSNLARIRPDGSDYQHITHFNNIPNIYMTTCCTWSPDGQWVAFDSGYSSGGPTLYRVRVDGSHFQSLPYRGQVFWAPPVAIPYRSAIPILIGSMIFITALIPWKHLRHRRA
jgi:Tol biopolymer transport system component